MKFFPIKMYIYINSSTWLPHLKILKFTSFSVSGKPLAEIDKIGVREYVENL